MTRFVPKNNAVFEYKTPGVEFFIILSGGVNVYKPIGDAEAAKVESERILKLNPVPFTSLARPERSSFEGRKE